LTSRPRVLIVFNQPVLPADHPDFASESDVLESVDEVEKVLTPDEFEVKRLGYARDPRILLNELERCKPDVVFNLFEGEADRTATEVYHAALLEWTRVPFTGSASAALAIGRDKVRTKYLLQGAGLRSAAFAVWDRPSSMAWPHGWPAIVKPACQDASVGIDQGSVVTSQEQLETRAALLFERFGGPILVEQFIDGREFHVNLIEENGQPRVLPPTEIRFAAGEGYWPVYTYEGKWNESSVEYKNTPLDTGLALPSPLREHVDEICSAAFQLVGMRDYGRVDLRVTPEGEPFVLEVNPNPYLNSIALVDGLKAVGRNFPEFIRGMVRETLGRGG
jgi:D-alanine-D-alanine ligase